MVEGNIHFVRMQCINEYYHHAGSWERITFREGYAKDVKAHSIINFFSNRNKSVQLHTWSFVAAHHAPSKPNAFTAFLRPDAAGVVADFSDEAEIWLLCIVKSSIPNGLWHLSYSEAVQKGKLRTSTNRNRSIQT